jgi:hypothetical protein
MTKKSDKPNDNAKAQLLVYGLDEAGKPKGARFPASERETVLPIVTAMKLEYSQPSSNEVASLGMKLPVGRIYARGKAFIPNIKRDLYDKLLAVAASCEEEQDGLQSERTAATMAEPEGNSGSVKTPTTAPAILPPLTSGLPQNWESIAVGNMVLADEGPGEGYWQAIVISRDGDIVTLRYRDYPKVPQFDRHISTIGLINPRPA